jgi:carboxymethylenebutenolidase
LLFTPDGDGPHAAVVVGPEGTGITRVVRNIAGELADRGFVALVPDFFRGGAPDDPEDLSDIDAVMAVIGRLDFGRATHDVLDTVEYARTLPNVDPARVATWGYCTGATMALLAAALDPQLAAAVLFYPSQPTFDALDDHKPVHPIDLLWNVRCPLLLLLGDQDPVITPDPLAEIRRRLETANVEHEIHLYAGAGHAFCTDFPGFLHEEAARRATSDALAFVASNLDL